MRLFQGEISVLQSVGKIMIFKCLPVLLLVLAAGLSGVYMVCPVDQGSLTVLRTKKTSCPFFHSSLALGKETCLLMDKFLVIIITHTKCIFYISCCLSPTALVGSSDMPVVFGLLPSSNINFEVQSHFYLHYDQAH